MNSRFQIQKLRTQTQIQQQINKWQQYPILYVRYHTLQSHIYTTKTSNNKTECKERQTLNLQFVQNELLREFCAHPIPISSSWILRDSQRTKFHISFYRTTAYVHLQHKRQEVF